MSPLQRHLQAHDVSGAYDGLWSTKASVEYVPHGVSTLIPPGVTYADIGI